MKQVVVVGAGVSGLTTSLMLAEAGATVTLVTMDPPLQTTSVVAAAFWYPYLVEPAESAHRWALRSLDYFAELTDEPRSGVWWSPIRTLFERPTEDPSWASSVHDFHRLQPSEIPPGYVDGFRFRTVVVQMPVYLPYLTRRLNAAGVSIVQRRIDSLAELAQLGPQVVNCTGLGSAVMLGDQELYPVRGQISRVPAAEVTDVDEITFAPHDEVGPLYIVPRRGDLILGGTDERAGDLTPDPAIRDRIARRCLATEPRLNRDSVVHHAQMLVGLRPCRRRVRLESEVIGQVHRIVHNYGHGGAGVTLSWGCAEDVLQLLGVEAEQRHASSRHGPS